MPAVREKVESKQVIGNFFKTLKIHVGGEAAGESGAKLRKLKKDSKQTWRSVGKRPCQRGYQAVRPQRKRKQQWS